MISLVCLLFSLISLSKGTFGVDVSSAVSEAHWKCLSDHGTKFAIIRGYMSTGHPDPEARESIRAARLGGIPNVDVYLFPCVPCGNPRVQVNEMITHLAGHEYGRIWIDIERLSWHPSLEENRKFIVELLDEIKAKGRNAGVYTNYYNWESIVGLSWSGASGHPLWYAHYDGEENFRDFQKFGGWSKPTIKQYLGNKDLCSVGVDYNWHPS